VISGARDYPEGDLTRQQIALIRENIEAVYDRITEVVDMLCQYADAGGQDWQTWNTLLTNGLTRAAMKMMVTCAGAVHPDWPAAADKAIAKAAGQTVKDGVLPETVHRTLATGVLLNVWQAGAHYLIDPDSWQDLLPAVVIGAVRNAPHVNDDHLMQRSRDQERYQ